jgi:hypothetical protein
MRRPTRLHRNESPFGTTDAVMRAWERQRTADPGFVDLMGRVKQAVDPNGILGRGRLGL